MTPFRKDLLLDIPAYPADGYAKLADRLGAILGTRNDVLLFQGEAIIALEAVATSLSSPRIRALNIVTSLYGRLFGGWLRRGGAEVFDLASERPGMPVALEAFAVALDALPRTNLVALVHAESASGILNPLAEIAALAKGRGAAMVVDAVASVGGHPLDVDQLGIDVAVIGPQKALGGSAGISALSVSRRAWTEIERRGAPAQSALSLLDLKRGWLDAGRGALPGMPSALEFFALEAALDRVEAEGLAALVARHALAAAAARAGIRALGAPLWVEDGGASNLVTASRVPDGLSVDDLISHPAAVQAGIAAGSGDVADRLVRLNHTGARASADSVLASVLALGHVLRDRGRRVDLDAASDAVTASYAGKSSGPCSG